MFICLPFFYYIFSLSLLPRKSNQIKTKQTSTADCKNKLPTCFLAMGPWLFEYALGFFDAENKSLKSSPPFSRLQSLRKSQLTKTQILAFPPRAPATGTAGFQLTKKISPPPPQSPNLKSIPRVRRFPYQDF